MAVQVKRWKHNMQAPVVRQVRGILGFHEQGLTVTTSDFGEGAKQEAIKPSATPISLMNGDELANLLVEHSIEVRRTSSEIIELGEDEEE